jgi:hypothetical protein
VGAYHGWGEHNMSAYLVHPKAIDRVVAWAARRGAVPGGLHTAPIWRSHEDIPKAVRKAAVADPHSGGWGLDLGQVPPDDLGTILIRQNMASVRRRYSRDGRASLYGPELGAAMADTAPEDLPGPSDQTRLWSYKFRDPGVLRPVDVYQDCEDLIYQSQDAVDYEGSAAALITEAIRRDVIDAERTSRDADP